MHRHLIWGLLALLFSFSLTHAATLEIPTPNMVHSGIGVIAGWKCEAEGDITIRLNEGNPIPAMYGLPRADTIGVCGNDGRNGFFSYTNWSALGDGRYLAVAYDNGVEFARSVFEVMTTGEEFLRGVHGSCTIPDFPAPNETATFAWNQSTQHLELVDVRVGSSPLRCGEREFECVNGDWRDRRDSATHYRWYCVGEGEGIRCQVPKTTSEPEPEPPTDSSDIYPECGDRPNTCRVGTYRDLVDGLGYYRWECVGSSGLAFTCTEPYPGPFAQFEGQWAFSSTITRNCSLVSGRGEMSVHRGRLSGWFQQNETVRTGPGTYRRNFRYTIGGNVSETGVVNGRFEWSDGSRTDGWFTGTLSERSGSGTWEDTAGCVGNWTARKQAQ